MDIQCTEKELFIFKKIAHAAEELGIPCFLIGGFVRDKIIGRPTKDADIVCLGDGIVLAHAVRTNVHCGCKSCILARLDHSVRQSSLRSESFSVGVDPDR